MQAVSIPAPGGESTSVQNKLSLEKQLLSGPDALTSTIRVSATNSKMLKHLLIATQSFVYWGTMSITGINSF